MPSVPRQAPGDLTASFAVVYRHFQLLIRLRKGGLLQVVLSHLKLPHKPSLQDLRDALKQTPLAQPAYDVFLENWSRFFYLSARDIYYSYRRLESDAALHRILRDEVATPGTITLVVEQCRSPRFSKTPHHLTYHPQALLVPAEDPPDALMPPESSNATPEPPSSQRHFYRAHHHTASPFAHQPLPGPAIADPYPFAIAGPYPRWGSPSPWPQQSVPPAGRVNFYSGVYFHIVGDAQDDHSSLVPPGQGGTI